MIERQDSTATPSDSDAIRDQLREAAAKADADGVNLMDTELPSAKPGDEGEHKEIETRASKSTAENPKSDSPETSAEQLRKQAEAESEAEGKKGQESKTEKTGEQPRDGKGKFAEKKDEPEAGKKDSKFSRAEKEAARKEKTWKQIEADKEQIRKDKEAVAREREEIRRSREQGDDKTRGLPQLSSGEYMKAVGIFEKKAEKLLAAGDTEGAQEQLTLAREARAAAQSFAQKEQVVERQKHEQSWRETVTQVLTEHPEYDDETSDASKSMHQLLTENPVLTLLPDGFQKAHEILVMRKEAAEVPGLRTKIEELTKENERLIKLTTPHGGRNAGGHSAPTSDFASMTPAQQREALRQEAERADAVAA